MALSMILFLASCGEHRPEGLKLVVVQELPDANNSTVTIIDFDEEPPKRIELRVGESKHGIELVKVDFSTRTALIRRNGEEIQLEMGEGEQAADGDAEPAP